MLKFKELKGNHMKVTRRAESRQRRRESEDGCKGHLKDRDSAYSSAKHIYTQVIDDTTARTLLAVSSLSKEVKPQLQGKGGNKEGAAVIGGSIAKRALEQGIKKVVFDRSGFLYHGRIKALAEAARQNGLEF
jgi:large subunit ribosomal protein L18